MLRQNLAVPVMLFLLPLRLEAAQQFFLFAEQNAPEILAVVSVGQFKRTGHRKSNYLKNPEEQLVRYGRRLPFLLPTALNYHHVEIARVVRFDMRSGTIGRLTIRWV